MRQREEIQTLLCWHKLVRYTLPEPVPRCRDSEPAENQDKLIRRVHSDRACSCLARRAHSPSPASVASVLAPRPGSQPSDCHRSQPSPHSPGDRHPNCVLHRHAPGFRAGPLGSVSHLEGELQLRQSSEAQGHRERSPPLQFPAIQIQ
jgi:hypothetical protein